MSKYSLYNGVKLPTVDMDRFYPQYQYVQITKSGDWYDVLITDSKSEVVYEYTPTGAFLSAVLYNYGNGYRSRMLNTDDAWDTYHPVSPENGSLLAGVTSYTVLADGYEGQEQNSDAVVWSNYDIRYSNGNLYKNAGDDPVPVEDETPEEGETPGEENNFDLKRALAFFALGLTINPLTQATNGPVTPGTPAVPQYLYGYQSAKGNAGLLVGNDIVRYNGAVFPALPEWDKTKYPYAILEYRYDDEYFCDIEMGVLICSSEPIQYGCAKNGIQLRNYSVVGDVQCFGYVTRASLWGAYFDFSYPYPATNEWLLGSENHYDERTAVFTEFLETIAWANHDVYYTDDSFDYSGNPIPPGTLYKAETDMEQIPVSCLAGYGYNDTVLPKLPDWHEDVYPYAMILYWTDKNEYWLYICTAEAEIRTDVYRFEQPVRYVAEGDSFAFKNYSSVLIADVGLAIPIWANYKMTTYDGNVLKATEPFPVYK